MNQPEWVLFPVIIPLAGAAVGLLLRHHRRLQAYGSLGTILTALAASLYLLARVYTHGPQVAQLGGWAAPYGISLTADLTSALFVVMAQAVLSTGFIYALGCNDRCSRYPTFYPLFLTLSTGLTGVFLTGDLFNLFVFAELLVISGAALTAISDDPLGLEAAYKYFLISLLASLFLLVAAGSLYVSYGTLNLADLSARIAADPTRPLTGVAAACLVVFFLVKSAVAPFHFWQPDFHTVSPTAVSAMLSSVVVKVGVYGLLRMTTLWFVPFAAELRAFLIAAGLVGVVFGGLTAVGAQHAKRMLAYSTLGQIGFILVGIGWGTPLALTAALIFIINHSLIKSALLMIAGAAASRAPVKSAAFSALRGVGKFTPLGGALFLLGGLALAGIPPTNGFISKLTLLRSGLALGDGWALAGLAAGSLFSLVYVARAYRNIWWLPAQGEIKPKPGGDHLLAPAILVSLSLVLGIWAEPFVNLCVQAAAWMLNPAAYIALVLGG